MTATSADIGIAGAGPARVRLPAESIALVPALARTSAPNVWVWEYDGPDGWLLSIATHGAPGSGTLSLGGFRIAPADRAGAPGYDNAREAIGLAMGMEEKIRWSRRIRCGGPRGLAHLDRKLLRSAWDDFRSGAWDGARSLYALWLYEIWSRGLTT